MQAFHDEYFVGINGSPSLEDREKGGRAWRNFRSARQTFSKKLKVANYLRPLISQYGATAAIALAQEKLDSIPKRGVSKAPNWAAFIKEISPPVPRQKRVLDETSDEEEDDAAEEEWAEMRADGSRVEEAECHAGMHKEMARSTGI